MINYEDYLNENHPSLNVTARLLTKDNYAAYKTNYQTILETQAFWLGSGGTGSSGGVRYGSVYTKNTATQQRTKTVSTITPGVRPVIEINVSNI